MLIRILLLNLMRIRIPTFKSDVDAYPDPVTHFPQIWAHPMLHPK
jgi:hypothetical protein